VYRENKNSFFVWAEASSSKISSVMEFGLMEKVEGEPVAATLDHPLIRREDVDKKDYLGSL